MKIAYISFEHPLGITGGGIGTYLGQIASLMARMGHKVEVFTAHLSEEGTTAHEGYLVHRVVASANLEFRKKNLAVFTTRHSTEPFDLMEAGEYGADALLIKKKFPGLPLVIKLHTPAYLTSKLNDDRATLLAKTRFYLGGLLRGKIHRPFWIYRKSEDLEYEQFCLADSISSPSKSLAKLVQQEWPTSKNITVIAYPFIPNSALLDIPAASYATGKLVVSFFGRLEKRKGILELMRAIPIVLETNPDIIFRFIGKAHPSPVSGMDMEAFLKHRIRRWTKNLVFMGYQPYTKIAGLLAETQICVFPSLWENFPNVCLEAMSAGRAVIASENGGMAEMITNGENGLLVSPTKPVSIAKAIIRLADNSHEINSLGTAARKKVLQAYNAEKIGAIVSEYYLSTVNTISVHK